MAKTKSAGRSTAYNLAAVLLALVTLINMVLVYYMYMDNERIGNKTSTTMNTINSVNGELQSINQRVLTIIADIGTEQSKSAIADSIVKSFDSIDSKLDTFETYEGLSDATLKRCRHARVFLEAYRNRLNAFREQYNTEEGFSEGISLKDLYTQDIYPLETTATEMLIATIGINAANTARQQARTRQIFYVTELIMAALLVVGELIIFLFAKRAKKVQQELEEREKNLQEVGAKLRSTRQKASDLALTNLLTGMKNRYALDNDISGRLESDRFNIAVFDMDNFRIINDTYGYEFGDEYLAAIAEKLKEEFGEVAEIYNITGNEFCFLFNKEYTESQSMAFVQRIHSVMSSPFTVLNITVQLTVSGAAYHYLPGDCLNVNSLLVKLDTTMRNAKMNGGNMVNTVVNM
ncbi:MAG TPA: GGDEF domain-containing protein [Ruminococcus sp.]|nr:GGDEF domain-containing protein [Ruminococcus sp.]